MGLAAILVMWPGPFIKKNVPSSEGDTKWNLALIGHAVSEKKMYVPLFSNMYSPGAGADKPLWSMFFNNSIIQSI